MARSCGVVGFHAASDTRKRAGGATVLAFAVATIATPLVISATVGVVGAQTASATETPAPLPAPLPEQERHEPSDVWQSHPIGEAENGDVSTDEQDMNPEPNVGADTFPKGGDPKGGGPKGATEVSEHESCPAGPDRDLVLSADGLQITVRLTEDVCANLADPAQFTVSGNPGADAKSVVVVITSINEDGETKPESAPDGPPPIPYDISFEGTEGMVNRLRVTATQDPIDVIQLPDVQASETIEMMVTMSDSPGQPTIGLVEHDGSGTGASVNITVPRGSANSSPMALRFPVGDGLPAIALNASRPQQSPMRLTLGARPRLSSVEFRLARSSPLTAGAFDASAIRRSLELTTGHVFAAGPTVGSRDLTITTMPTVHRTGILVIAGLVLVGLVLAVLDRWDRIDPMKNPRPWLN